MKSSPQLDQCKDIFNTNKLSIEEIMPNAPEEKKGLRLIFDDRVNLSNFIKSDWDWNNMRFTNPKIHDLVKWNQTVEYVNAILDKESNGRLTKTRFIDPWHNDTKVHTKNSWIVTLLSKKEGQTRDAATYYWLRKDIPKIVSEIDWEESNPHIKNNNSIQTRILELSKQLGIEIKWNYSTESLLDALQYYKTPWSDLSFIPKEIERIRNNIKLLLPDFVEKTYSHIKPGRAYKKSWGIKDANVIMHWNDSDDSNQHARWASLSWNRWNILTGNFVNRA